MRQKRVHSKPLMRGMTKAEADRYMASTNSLVITLYVSVIFVIVSACVNLMYYGGTGIFEGLLKMIFFMITVFVTLLAW